MAKFVLPIVVALMIMSWLSFFSVILALSTEEKNGGAPEGAPPFFMCRLAIRQFRQ